MPRFPKSQTTTTVSCFNQFPGQRAKHWPKRATQKKIKKRPTVTYEIAKLPAWNPLVVMMPFLTKVIKKEANWNGKITLVSSAGTDPSLGALGVDTRVFVSDQGGLKEWPNTKKTYTETFYMFQLTWTPQIIRKSFKRILSVSMA